MKKIIEVGTCYRDSTVCWSQWRVVRIFANFLGMPHAVVISLSDPTVSRTIACHILSDKRRFETIDSNAALDTDPAIAIDPAIAAEQAPLGPGRLGIAA